MHACYRCLLGEKEVPTLNKLRNLALQRRGMRIIQDEGYRDDSDFAADLHVDLQTAAQLSKHLKKRRYLVGAPGSHRAGFSKTRKPFFMAVKEGPAYEAMIEEYFDPLVDISHHYDMPPAKQYRPGPHTQELLATQDTIRMPPPTSPTRATRRTTAARQVASSAEQENATHFEKDTASTARQNYIRSAKQAALAELNPNIRSLVVQTPTKKRGRSSELSSVSGQPMQSSPKRFKSSQTKHFINAGDVGSSPTPI
ncbi:hypothetical protein LTR66_002101 [Elasticomyces elasticus]|nr:hypothetical protein LTR66_002101 [Elasticomyces elasticus]